MERLQKVIAQAGITSRRKAETLILEGRVKVNGHVVTALGTQVAPSDEIRVDDNVIQAQSRLVYYLFHKPRNILATNADDRGRPTMMTYLKDIPFRVYPIGRLDFQTSGALLLSNDGELTEKLTKKFDVLSKTFLALVTGYVNDEDLNEMRQGATIDNVVYPPMTITRMKFDSERHTTVLLINIKAMRQVDFKVFFDYFHRGLLMFKRDAIEGMTIHGMAPGAYRELTPLEVEQLKQLANKLP